MTTLLNNTARLYSLEEFEQPTCPVCGDFFDRKSWGVQTGAIAALPAAKKRTDCGWLANIYNASVTLER